MLVSQQSVPKLLVKMEIVQFVIANGTDKGKSCFLSEMWNEIDTR